MRLVAITIVLMLVAVPATAMAAGPGGHRPAAAGADAAEEGRAFGLPEKALFGLCTAWTHMQKGREHGEAGAAPPFRWLQDQASAMGQAMDGFCSGHTRPDAAARNAA